GGGCAARCAPAAWRGGGGGVRADAITRPAPPRCGAPRSRTGVSASARSRTSTASRSPAATPGPTAAPTTRWRASPPSRRRGSTAPRPGCEHVFVNGAMGGATILHADLDAFYASVEQRDDPRLRGRPVIVGGGVVLAPSYEAEALGGRRGMGGAPARAGCPRGVVVEPRMSAYAEASTAVFDVFERTTPLVEGLSIDEAFLDVGGLRRLSGPAPAIARRLRREV